VGEPEGHVRLFRTAGPEVSRLLRAHERSHPGPYVRRLVASAPARRSSARAMAIPPQGLTRRELLVLGLLPKRLSETVCVPSVQPIPPHLGWLPGRGVPRRHPSAFTRWPHRRSPDCCARVRTRFS
jgi:hypothetical protein